MTGLLINVDIVPLVCPSNRQFIFPDDDIGHYWQPHVKLLAWSFDLYTHGRVKVQGGHLVIIIVWTIVPHSVEEGSGVGGALVGQAPTDPGSVGPDVGLPTGLGNIDIVPVVGGVTCQLIFTQDGVRSSGSGLLN